MKSLLGRHPGEDKEQMDKETDEEEARGPVTTTWTEEELNLDPELYLSSNSEGIDKGPELGMVFNLPSLPPIDLKMVVGLVFLFPQTVGRAGGG